ncbi:nicotinamide N-methyltransferase-like [Dendropsophus ebraccatus]|uniref:nicotinamide N-methyltransferase-like n=1 Tax=Dendropsophus ebraccatus TaxID=150705 RepID=UPI0038316E8F
MDSCDHKLYHVHRFDTRTALETYLSSKEDMPFIEDALKYPLMKLHSIFQQGHITGDRIYDISLGSGIHYLYPVCEFFKEITLLRVNETCVLELNKWLHTRTGAFDWSHTSEMMTDITGKRDQSLDPEMKLKAAMKPILKCDLHKENLADPEILPPADCVMTALLLDATSKDEDDYNRSLRKIVKLLKPGGHLILFGALNASYYMVGEERFHAFKYDEKFVKNAFTAEGLSIDFSEVTDREAKSNLSDYKARLFVVAHRDK